MSIIRIGRVVFKEAVQVGLPAVGAFTPLETIWQDPKPLNSRQGADVEMVWDAGLIVIKNRDGGTEDFVPATNVKQFRKYVEPKKAKVVA